MKFTSLLLLVAVVACGQQKDKKQNETPFEIKKTEAEWKKQLTAEEFYVLRQKGTERAFTGKLWDNHEHGVYTCAGCNQELFAS
jgi:peptide-methionine (R)-S-oxide reductase